MSGVTSQETIPAPALPSVPQGAGCGSVGGWGPHPCRSFPSSPPCASSLGDAFRAAWGGEVCGTMSRLALGVTASQLSEHRYRVAAKGWEWGLLNVRKQGRSHKRTGSLISCCDTERVIRLVTWPSHWSASRLSFLIFGRSCSEQPYSYCVGEWM